eukprot:TRINITY_DN22734_c0_g1_i1.p1 TRINITY_DN22734_c0_g1~~TRINITY_DN22734_c0_g1_i1.p1  ORF type:complete len:491 (+),score=104.42 TRINITY_DN22734_c0_g1_i1:39-1511(+)
MRIAVEGCAHGCLEEIYSTIGEIEKRHNYKVDLLLCCGDFQSVRNLEDLKTMACPDKFKATGSFYKYYSGELKAPIMTIFIGGNHEASNFLQELPYGGWVAPNIYFLGKAGVINVGGIRIGGLSGIYKPRDYTSGHHEHVPYSEGSKRSVYHIRNLEVFRLKQLRDSPPDIMMSHDWPCGITDHGNVEQLMRFKPFLRKDIEENALGSPPCMEILQLLMPKYWFSAHLHAKFSALVPHEESDKETKFLALDKCLPRRRFLQIIDLPSNDEGPLKISQDLAWLSILKSTNDLLSVSSGRVHMPGPGYSGRFDYRPTPEELEEIRELFKEGFEIRESEFEPSTKVTFADQKIENLYGTSMPSVPLKNSQTDHFVAKLGIHDPVQSALDQNKGGRIRLSDLRDEMNETSCSTRNEDEIVLSDDEEEEEKSDSKNDSSITQNASKEFIEEDSSFFIDTTPSTPLLPSGTGDEPHSKKRLIKRRNISIYQAEDNS